jgi:hypothetical protein
VVYGQARRNTLTLTFDANDIGNIYTNHGPVPGVVTFDPTTGRGTINIIGGFETGFMNQAAFYLYDAGKGFMIDEDPTNGMGVSNNAFSGGFVPQAAGPFTVQDISGNLIARAGASASSDIPNLAAGVNAVPASGTLSADGDLASVQLGNVPNIFFTDLHGCRSGAWSRDGFAPGRRV